MANTYMSYDRSLVGSIDTDGKPLIRLNMTDGKQLLSAAREYQPTFIELIVDIIRCWWLTVDIGNNN